ncbi:phosphatase PAP2 family protein [Streptacidiphilus sp. EB129]|uniref:phosphatase PAP2 family protein n=1 Tax=Streptacidiphilus sp. EB129 TaxID=3156262 RepID=UPI0035161B8D
MRSQRKEVALLDRPQTTPPLRPAERDVRLPQLSRAHKWAFGTTAAFYLAIVLAVLTSSALVSLDWAVMIFKPYEHWPGLQPFLDVYVVAGQRGPSAIVVALWLGWRSWRARSLRPLLVVGVALVLLNMSVGAVKIGTGRLGPHYAHVAGSSELFQGGGIFPSGHTANAVVTWGIVAYLAVRWRRLGAVLAGFMGFSIGMTTIYLGTHWTSDVLSGWAAGALVLLALPLFEPVIVSADERIQAAWRDRRPGLGSLAPPLDLARQFRHDPTRERETGSPSATASAARTASTAAGAASAPSVPKPAAKPAARSSAKAPARSSAKPGAALPAPRPERTPLERRRAQSARRSRAESAG